MNVFDKITLQFLCKNKTRTIVTIIGIILSSSMICAVTTSVSSLQNYAVQNAIYNEGDWHGSVFGLNQTETAELLSSQELAGAVYNQCLGYALAEGCKNEYKPYLYVIGSEPGFENTMPIHLTQGEYPHSHKELLLPSHLASNGGVRYKIGDTLTLRLGDRILEGETLNQFNPYYSYGDNGEEVPSGEDLIVRETRTYTVSGFYERPSFEDYSAPGFTAITLADETADKNALYDVYFKMKSPKKVYSFMASLPYAQMTNSTLLMYSGASRYDSFYRVLWGFAAIVIVLIMFGSVSLIYNAFSISVSERTRQFGLLSSVGATRRQLRRMIFSEALTVSLIGIPLGILAGIGGIGITLLLIGNKFQFMGSFPIPMRICISPAAVLTACSVALVTVLISAWIPSRRAARVSAVEAIRQNTDIKIKDRPARTSKLTYRFFGLPGVLAAKYYHRNRKKYRVTIVSLFMSIVLFVSASAFTNYLMDSVEGGFSKSGYDISFFCQKSDLTSLSAEELFSLLKGSTGIKEAVYLQECSSQGEIPANYLTKEMAELLNTDAAPAETDVPATVYLNLLFVNDADFRSLLAENHLEESLYMNPENPLGLAVDSSVIFNSEQGKFVTLHYLNSDTSEITLSACKKIDGYSYERSYEDENGHVFYQYISMDHAEETLDLPEEDAQVPFIIKTGKILENRPFFISYSTQPTVIYPYSLISSVIPNQTDITADYGFYFTSSNHAQSYQEMQKILEDEQLNSSDLYDNAAFDEENRNIITIIQVFSYGFTVLISLIAAANVFNTISTNISLRRREFSMLKSVGMTDRGLRKMMNFECLLYGTKSLLFGLPVSAVFTYFIYRTVAEGYATDFYLPWSAIGISVLSVFLVVFATMLYSMRKIKKENPIDTLKNENL